MSELADWLSSLPPPRIEQLARQVLGTVPGSRAVLERALAQRLSDPAWVRSTLARLGAGAQAAWQVLVDAKGPVRRSDLLSLTADRHDDVIDALESYGLVTAVKFEPGMPTHVALTPGVSAGPSDDDAPPAPARLQGLSFASARRRFQLALTMGLLFQHPPRLTRSGALHTTDLSKLSQRLQPLGVTPRRLAQEVSALQDLGALAMHDERLRPVPSLALDIPALHLRLALEELASPSLPDEAAAAVARLLEPEATLSLSHLLEVARARLLRQRADEDERPTTGARADLVHTLTALLSLESLVLLDDAGHPVTAEGDALLAQAPSIRLALNPQVATVLRGEPPEGAAPGRGHVQASFEIVADASADPSLVAVVCAFSRLMRADMAAVMRLEKDSVRRALAAGLQPTRLAAALEALSGRPLPPNVAVTLTDWLREAPSPPTSAAPPVVSLDRLRDAALARLVDAVES